MPVVIDGNNLLHSLPVGNRSRAEVRRHVLDLVRNESIRVEVVFDGPPPAGSPEVENLGRARVRYSGSMTADEVILGLIPAGRNAAQWSVVTDDRALQNSVRGRGAQVRSLAQWRGRGRAPVRRGAYESRLSSHEVSDWEEFFASGGDREDS